MIRNFDFIQTGRSTRMRDKAIDLALKGIPVYIVSLTCQHSQWQSSMVKKTWDRMTQGRPMPKIMFLAFDGEIDRDWDWVNMRPRSSRYDDVQFLIDHTVVEMKIARLNEEIKHLATLAGKLYPHTV